MTLIAAWFKNDLKIIASDSLITYKNPTTEMLTPIKGNPQKIFASEKVAIALFGSFGTRINLFKKERLISQIFEKENWDYLRFKKEISNFLENEKINNSNDDYESNILIAPINQEPEIIRIRFNKIQKEFPFSEYKEIHQIKDIGDLFFSEQEIDGEIDFKHQEHLLEHFNHLKEIVPEKLCIYNDDPYEVRLMIRLVLNSMNSDYSLINRNNIGGDKVYYAYNYKNETWKQDYYPKPVISDSEIDFNELELLITSNKKYY